ncbi:MAG: hypothetical protein ACYCYP_13090 [Leptospirales bacterium]
MKHEIVRKTVDVSANLLIQTTGGNPVQLGQVRIEHDLLTPHEKDPGGNGFNRNGRKESGHRLLKS